MAKTLEGKVAVVTGASSGIGKSIVEKYAEAGALVVAFARNLDALKALEASYPAGVRHLTAIFAPFRKVPPAPARV